LKILFYNHTGTVSGAERVLSMILARLDRNRFNLVVVCPDASRMMELAASQSVRTRGLRQLDARFTWRPDRIVNYLTSFAKVISHARKLVVEESPDAIHANSIRAGLVMAAATIGLNVSVVWHAHDILPRHPLSTAVRLFAAVTSQNRILAVSHAVAERFRGNLLRPFRRRVPIQVIHNAVDLDRFHPDAEAREAMRRALNLGNTQPVVGIVGQLTLRKGQLELIEGFARVAREVPDAILLIVGEALFNRDQEYADQLKRTVALLGIADRVRFLGPRDDVPTLMQGLDLLVINSHEEPFALTVLEGLASGTAVLATSVGGTPEMIHHAENGWLVNRRDHDDLVSGLLTLLRDKPLRRQMGTNGRRDAIARFSTDRFMTEVLALYRAMLDGDQTPKPRSARSVEVRRVAGASRPWDHAQAARATVLKNQIECGLKK
jgi:glycosyltransferase involved in cell wall biosynthesis